MSSAAAGELLAAHHTSALFTREHDLILLATPFSLTGRAGSLAAAWSPAHTQRLAETLERRFLRSARALDGDILTAALDSSCTPSLGYRLTPEPGSASFSAAGSNPGLLLTCASNAHLALANLLERNAVFTVDTIGRVTARHPPPPFA